MLLGDRWAKSSCCFFEVLACVEHCEGLGRSEVTVGASVPLQLGEHFEVARGVLGRLHRRSGARACRCGLGFQGHVVEIDFRCGGLPEVAAAGALLICVRFCSVVL